MEVRPMDKSKKRQQMGKEKTEKIRIVMDIKKNSAEDAKVQAKKKTKRVGLKANAEYAEEAESNHNNFQATSLLFYSALICI
jgi:hypothetical protein